MKTYTINADKKSVTVDGQVYKIQTVRPADKPEYYRIDFQKAPFPTNWVRVKDLDNTNPIEFDENKVGATKGCTFTKGEGNTTTKTPRFNMRDYLDGDDLATYDELYTKAKAKYDQSMAQSKKDNEIERLKAKLAALGVTI